MLYAYLRLLIFLPTILIPACASSSPAFHMMYSAYKLNKQGDNTHPWHTPFPIWNQSVVSYPVLTVASCSWILRRQVRWSGIPISWRMFHSLCCATFNMPTNWKTQQWPQEWKRSVFIPIPKKGNVKKYSNYCTIALISHTSKVMLKILQVRLQQCVNRELPDVQAGFRKSRG